MILFFSDLHIGSKQSPRKPADIISICNYLSATHVYFVGDTIDLMLSEDNRIFLEEIKRNLKIPHTFINGNHDAVFGQDILTISYSNFKIRMLHGHQYESRITTLLDPITVVLNEVILKITGLNLQKILRSITTKTFPEGPYPIKLYNQRKQVLEHGYGVDFLISGHTHCPEVSQQIYGYYCNPGNWETFLSISEDGPKIHFFKDYI